MENKPIYCVNAFHTLSVNSIGSCKPCCMAEGASDWNRRVIDTPIADIWEDQYFIDIRNSLNQGIKHAACKKCWDEEDAGRDSKRIRDNKRLNFNNSDKIKSLELNLGNTCNIRCRTCHPYSSSKWVKEYYDINVGVEKDFKIYLKESKIYNDCWEDNSLLWSELDKIGKDIERIEFYGGEPFLIKRQWDFVKKCVSEGWSKNQVIHYNTNGTIWKEEDVELFKHFKLVEVGFSIDGLKDKFEFMRYLADWNVVLENLNKAKLFKEGKNNLQFDICHTISSLNVFYIPEFIDYFSKDWPIYLNLVHLPNYYAVTIFPDTIKKLIIEKLNQIDEASHDQIKGIKNLIMQGTFDQTVWDEFKRRIEIHDKYRNQDYYQTFPEFGEIIRRYG